MHGCRSGHGKLDEQALVPGRTQIDDMSFLHTTYSNVTFMIYYPAWASVGDAQAIQLFMLYLVYHTGCTVGERVERWMLKAH